MNSNGFHVSLNTPKAISGNKGVSNLPPYCPSKTFEVEHYNCPETWMRGNENAKSYFFEVKEDLGMWFDFNKNKGNEKDVAVVISVQKINPIDNEPISDLRMVQYNKCPIHYCEFEENNFCRECNFKHPYQNYISTTICDKNDFWNDGFCTPEGVRQFFFTKEECRGIAEQIIGNEKSYSIGFAFYESKQNKPRPPKIRKPMPYKKHTLIGKNEFDCDINHILDEFRDDTFLENDPKEDFMSMKPQLFSPMGGQDCYKVGTGPLTRGLDIEESIMPAVAKADSLEEDNIDIDDTFDIGAGCTIRQEYKKDPKELNYWEEKPSAVIYVNYCNSILFNKIMKEGKRKEVTLGKLSRIKVGN